MDMENSDSYIEIVIPYDKEAALSAMRAVEVFLSEVRESADPNLNMPDDDVQRAYSRFVAALYNPFIYTSMTVLEFV